MLRAMFTPNKAGSTKMMAMIAITQIFAFFVIWIVMAPKIIPRPMEVLQAFGPLWRQGIAGHLWVSLTTNLIALFFTMVISLFFAYSTAIPFMRPPAAAISKMRFLGLTGLTLIFTLLIGGGLGLKVAITVFGMTVFTVTNLVAMIKIIPPEKYDHARTLRYSETRIVWEVVVRGKLDEVIEIMRQNAAIGWMMLAMVEGMVRSEGGIGSVLLTQNKYFNLSAVFAIQVMIFFAGIGTDWVLSTLKHIACPWAVLKLGRR